MGTKELFLSLQELQHHPEVAKVKSFLETHAYKAGQMIEDRVSPTGLLINVEDETALSKPVWIVVEDEVRAKMNYRKGLARYAQTINRKKLKLIRCLVVMANENTSPWLGLSATLAGGTIMRLCESDPVAAQYELHKYMIHSAKIHIPNGPLLAKAMTESAVDLYAIVDRICGGVVTPILESLGDKEEYENCMDFLMKEMVTSGGINETVSRSEEWSAALVLFDVVHYKRLGQRALQKYYEE